MPLNISLCQNTTLTRIKTAIMRKRITLKVNETRSFELESHEGGGYPYQGFPQYLMMLAPIQVMTVQVNHGEGDENDQGDEDSGDHMRIEN